MGSFLVPLDIGDRQGERWETVEAVVDTGASYTFVPASLLQRLGVLPQERRPFRLADERLVEYDLAQTQVRLDGRTRFTIVVFGPEGVEPLLGVVTLEEFGLGVDPVGRRLIPVPGLLLLARPCGHLGNSTTFGEVRPTHRSAPTRTGGRIGFQANFRAQMVGPRA